MARFIIDSYIKQGKKGFGEADSADFDRRVLAVNDMYAFLYTKGILGSVSFQFKDYEKASYFALDVKDLLPYRSMMEASGLPEAALAVRHIFDEPYTPCRFSGAIQPGWTMSTYRSVDGCVDRSWECDMIKGLNADGAYKILDVKESMGIKAAATALFGEYEWAPSPLDKTTSLDTKIQSAASRVSDHGDVQPTKEHSR